MASNRSSLLTKTHKVLKKHYTAAPPNPRLPVLEQLIYAACLEDAMADHAQQAFAALEEQFFDWNEIRVSTITELTESMTSMPDPRAAAVRVKRALQSVFEANYSFDLEQLKKENIGAAVKKLQKFDGVTPFGVSFVTQTALGGHSVPVSRGGMKVLYVVGVVNEKERKTGSVPGLERAIPKSKGVEFGSLLNQAGMEFLRAPHGPAIRKILLEIAPDAKERLPKRGGKKPKEKAKPAEKATTTKKPTSKKPVAAKTPKKPAPGRKVPATKKVTVKKKKAPAGAKKKTSVKAKKKVPKKKTSSKRLSKRKPR